MAHQHHHHPGRTHPPATLSLSLLRLSVWLRLSLALVMSTLLWLAVLWAMG